MHVYNVYGESKDGSSFEYLVAGSIREAGADETLAGIVPLPYPLNEKAYGQVYALPVSKDDKLLFAAEDSDGDMIIAVAGKFDVASLRNGRVHDPYQAVKTLRKMRKR